MTQDLNTLSRVANPLLDCPPLEAAVVRFIRTFENQHVTPELRTIVSRTLRDQLSAQIGNSRLPWSRKILAFAGSRHMHGRSTVIPTGVSMSASDAAFVNSSLSHGFEFDEGHRASGSHPGCCVVPTALAVAEEIDASLDDVIAAIIVGYEVYARIGILAAPDLIESGFHPATVLASFGAAAVVAKLRDFDDETTFHALSIALSHASGTTEYTSSGGSVKRVQPAIGVRGGMFAADLAQAGVTGPRAFLSGVKGFYRTFVRRSAAEDAAQRFSVMDGFEIRRAGYKRYCCCGCNHAYIDIMSEYAGRVDEIKKLSVRIQRLSNNMVGTGNANVYDPKNIEQVQWSLPTQLAFALLGYGNAYKVHLNYLDGKLDMDLVLRVARLVEIVQAPELDERYPGKFVADVTLTFRDGATEHRFVEDSVGTSGNPMPESAHDAKFMELTTDLLGADRATNLLAALHTLDSRMSVNDLTAMASLAV